MVKYSIGECFLGRTLVMDSGKTEIAITLDVGPRIISLKKKGGENIMFEDVDDAVNKDVSAIYGLGKKWHIYGGHRIWLSPEHDGTYYPDNDKVEYEKIENGAVFTPPVWKGVNVATKLSVKFLNAESLEIKMSVTNLADSVVPLSIWALTVMKCGAKVSIKLNTKDTGYLANRNLSLWSYSSITDSRLQLKDGEIIVESDVSATTPFKLGTFVEDAVIKYERGDTTFKKSVKGNPQGVYPDFYNNIETYTSNLIHEIETLSEIKNVGFSETLEHTEIWEIV